jgi:curved DNA-binding protein CbpA
MSAEQTPAFSGDPYETLDLPMDASQEAIRAAYVGKVKQFPPDRAPADFERIRDAYELLRDPRRRAAYFLFSADPEASFVSLLADRPEERRFAGPGPWLAVVKGGQRA